MEWTHLIVLALIQGLTEFLPVSSSAHLILPSQLFGWTDQGLAFDVAVHVGTLAAVVLYFRTQLREVAVGWTRQLTGHGSSPESRLGWSVIAATLPILVVGGLLANWIELTMRSMTVIALTTIIFGLLLWWADRLGKRSREMPQIDIRVALLIGLAQVIALVPGTSRSGITLTAGLLLGFTRQASARFSFLLSIPLIAAAGVFKGVELWQTGGVDGWRDPLLGAMISFITALVCIKAFLALLDRIGMLPFVIYRLVLGGALLLVL